jgi:hypothetical protein
LKAETNAPTYEQYQHYIECEKEEKKSILSASFMSLYEMNDIAQAEQIQSYFDKKRWNIVQPCGHDSIVSALASAEAMELIIKSASEPCYYGLKNRDESKVEEKSKQEVY